MNWGIFDRFYQRAESVPLLSVFCLLSLLVGGGEPGGEGAELAGGGIGEEKGEGGQGIGGSGGGGG